MSRLWTFSPAESPFGVAERSRNRREGLAAWLITTLEERLGERPEPHADAPPPIHVSESFERPIVRHQQHRELRDQDHIKFVLVHSG
jgi:hypothetical protein